MIRDRQLGAAKVVPLAAQLRHGSVDGQQSLGRDCTQGHNRRRLDDFDLAHQEWRTGFAFVALWRSIAWRTALDDIRDIDLLALQSHGLDHVVEKLPSASHERFALQVFVGSGGLANEHQVRRRISHAKDNLLAPLFVQTATRAVTDIFADQFERLDWLGNDRFCARDFRFEDVG